MKHFLFTVFVFSSFWSYAQKIKLGLRTGASFSNFYDHYTDEAKSSPVIVSNPSDPAINPVSKFHYKTDFTDDMRVGFYSSLSLGIILKERVSFEGGLGYSQKGINMKYSLHSTSGNTESSYQFDRNLRLDYLVIPATIQYGIGKKQRLYILGGIYNSFAVNFVIRNSLVVTDDKTYNSSGLMTETKTEASDKTTYAKTFDFGVIGGLGFNFPVSQKMTLGLDLRSAVGLTSVPANYQDYGFQSFSANTKNITFETGLKLQYILK